MNKFKFCIGLLLSLPLVAVSVQASEAKSEMSTTKKSLVISNAWIRLMPPVTNSTAAYFTLENQSDKAIEIVAISTVIAKNSTMHDTVVENDMATMVALEVLSIASESKVVFAPGGKHLMIMGLTEPLTKNKDVNLHFELKNGQKIIATMKAYKNNPYSEDNEDNSMEHKDHHE